MNLIEKESTFSTCDDIKELISPEEWTTVLAYEQKGGKGTKGREFVSPVGGVYFSFVFRPSVELLPTVTPLVAVAVRETVKDFIGKDCDIKWVNDLIFDGKKVCGILTECKTDGKESICYVGVGVNLFRSKEGFGKYSDIAGYLSDGEYDRGTVRDFAKSAVERVKLLSNSDYMTKYVEYSCAAGREAEYIFGNIKERAVVKSINLDGSITLLFPDREETVISGEIRLI